MASFPRLSWRRAAWLAPLVLICCLLSLFVLNGVWLASGETPLVKQTGHPAVSELAAKEVAVTELADAGSSVESPRIKILAYNIAKGFVHQGGVSFASEAEVTARMTEIATLIEAEQPDLVFLSEAILECGPSPVNQVEFIAQQTGMASWAFGENFNFGLPGYRMISGNAILSRSELTPVANFNLAGRQPFYITKNNRRVLFCRTKITGQNVLLASIHTDSFDIENNLKQTQQILDFCANEPTILVGDFNCRPNEPSIPLILQTGRFVGSTDDVGTFPAQRPDRTIDFIFAPAGWELIEHRVIENTASDHRPIVALFEVK